MGTAAAGLKFGEKLFGFLDGWFAPKNTTYRVMRAKLKLANKAMSAYRKSVRADGKERSRWVEKEGLYWDKYSTLA